MQRVWPARSSSLKPRRNFHIKVCQEVGISASCLPTIKSNSEIYGYVKNAGCSDCFRTIQHGCEHRKHSIYLYMIYTKASSLLFRLHSERNFLAAFSTTMPSQLVIVAVFDCRCHALKACQSVARWVTSMRLYLGMLAWTWARQKTPMVQADIYLILMPSEFASPFSEMWICSFQLFGPFVSIRSIYWGRKVWKCQAASCFSTLDLTQYHRSTVSWQLLGTNSAPRQRSVLQSCSLPWKHDER